MRSDHNRRRRSWLVIIASVAVVAALSAIGYLTLRPETARQKPNKIELTTESVVLGDIVESVRQVGKLGFGASRDLGSPLQGVITGLPHRGATVHFGDALFRINDSPVVLFHGDLPAWRPYTAGMPNGNDVEQLEANLANLGFFRQAPDAKFDRSTMRSIKLWQKAQGMEDTGSLELGRIVFLPSIVRVDKVAAKVGDASSASTLSVTGTRRVISANFDPGVAAAVRKGTKLSVELPNGRTVVAEVVHVGTPTERDNSDGGSKIEVPITLVLRHSKAAKSLTDVDVTVTVKRVLAKRALQVPVLALLAKPGGGFLVERVTPGGTERVGVELGTFANAVVAVTGGDLRVGDKVVVGQ